LGITFNKYDIFAQITKNYLKLFEIILSNNLGVCDYNENRNIVVFNMNDTGNGFNFIEEEENFILDLSINPLNSLIFYAAFDKMTFTDCKIM
jgi:hypothetical protein